MNACDWRANCGCTLENACCPPLSPLGREARKMAVGCAQGFADARCASRRPKSTEITMAQAKLNQVKDSRKRILLVDDHAVVRFGVAQLINQQSDLVVCGEEEDAAHALSAIARLKPDLVIADISLKDSSGLELMRNVKAQFNGLPVLVVSTHDESIYAEIAFRAGALGYLMKGDALNQIVTAIRRVLSGNIYVSDALAAKMLQQQVRGQTDIQQSPIKGLSDRELEVFQLLGQWRKTKEIAQELHLSIKTIEYYREMIKQKLSLKNATELTQYATSWVQRENPI
jgi:DNA-binding NarL/FixJ family response regulator